MVPWKEQSQRDGINCKRFSYLEGNWIPCYVFLPPFKCMPCACKRPQVNHSLPQDLLCIISISEQPSLPSSLVLPPAKDTGKYCRMWEFKNIQFSSVQFSHSVVSDSLRPHESQHARPTCPSVNSESGSGKNFTTLRHSFDLLYFFFK